MIFYFSGTGNSLYIAKQISTKQNERIISISKEVNQKKELYEYELEYDEKIIFAYPIYAWAPPKVVLDFISKLRLKNYNNNYICLVCTCGENIGDTVSIFSKKLKSIGLNLDSGFSLTMPNNYMVMGDVDDKDIGLKKIEYANTVLENINKVISNKEKGIFKVDKGPLPRVMTKIVNPMFNKFSIDTSRFYANNECIGCKICEKVCNTKTIKVDKKPVWGNECTGCLACINYCPKKAIQVGKSTLNKGRYINPYISIEEMTL